MIWLGSHIIELVDINLNKQGTKNPQTNMKNFGKQHKTKMKHIGHKYVGKLYQTGHHGLEHPTITQ